MKRCVITGFEPFGDWKINPSAEIALLLDSRKVNGYQISFCILPVKLQDLNQEMMGILEKDPPDLSLMLGLSLSSVIRLEKIAVNWIHSRIKYNDGHQPRDSLIIPDGQPAYFTTLPVSKLEKILRENGVPCIISPSAGNHTCNQAYYLDLHFIHVEKRLTKALFIHVPPTPAEIARKGVNLPSMPLSLGLKAVRLILDSF